MKIVIIGGHLTPALCVMEALPKDTKILFIGRKYALEGDRALSLEYKTIISLHIPFVGLNTGRLQRKLTKFTLLSLLKLPFGIIKSFLILIKFRPDVVVGFGGYVSVPVVLCAYFLRIPVVIHEQTLEAGFANRLLGQLATKICISWNSSRKYFSKRKVVFTGNPIRKFQIFNAPTRGQFSPLRPASAEASAGGQGFEGQALFNNRLPTIYITGGSSGSHFINVLIEGCVRQLLEKYNLIHQTGDAREFNDFTRLERLKISLPEKLCDNYILEKFIDPSEIGELISSSSLIISRSGANIVTELIYFEKPALLIPLPFSQNNEQLKNAKFLEKLGLGKVLQQEELDYEKLFKEIDLMFKNIIDYKVDKNMLRNLPGKKAAQNIISVINYVTKARKKIF